MRSVGYIDSATLLTIEFAGGEIYEYSGVPVEIYRGLMSAESQGRYFQENVRKKFRFIRK